LPSNSPHVHMILRVDLVGSHGRWKRPCLQTTAHRDWWGCRYLELIREGALEWNLDVEWRKRLDTVEAFAPFQTTQQRVGALVTLGAVLPVTLTAAVSPAGGETGERVFEAITDFTWGLHDGLWQELLGDGGKATKPPFL
jgi:hypothetical protein